MSVVPLCARRNVDMFPDEDDVEGTTKAVALCSACPIRQQCASDSLDTRERYGVRGGLTEADRRAMWRDGYVPTRPIESELDARRDEVARLAARDVAVSQIARLLGISRDRVSGDLYHLNGRKVVEDRQARAAAREAREVELRTGIARMLAERVPVEHMARRLGTDRKVIYRRLAAIREQVAA